MDRTKNKVKVRSKVNIKMHQRKITGKPSQEVMDYARENGIELKEGHTLVRKHNRSMDKNLHSERIVKTEEHTVSNNDKDKFNGFGEVCLSWDIEK